MLQLVDARYRCTSCGDCCRGWQVPLEAGEAERFLRQASSLVPVERLKGAIGHTRQGEREIDTLVGAARQCVMLTDEQLCRIHAAHGGEAKPRACRIFPFTFVATPTSVRVGLSFACPAVVDAEGPLLSEQRGEIEALFAGAVDGTHYLLRAGDSVALGEGVQLSWPEAETLLAELGQAFAPGSRLLLQVGRAGAICALVQARMGEGLPFAEAFQVARSGWQTLIEEALADPPAVDRLSRALFRTLLKTTEPDGGGAGRLGAMLASMFGGGSIRLRFGTGEVAWSAAEKVRAGLGPDGEALLARWLSGAIGALTFFGDSAFGLPIAGGLDLLVLSAAVAAFLARAHAAAEGRDAVELADVKRGLRQLDAGITHRHTMPRGFDRALTATASLDLLREQLG